MTCALSVNVDHVATLREARGGTEPDPARAAALALDGGAAGITVHLREDRRHIQDDDVRRLRAMRRGELNLEMALTEEMLAIALDLRPERSTLVPERREELTTEGGLDLMRHAPAVRRAAPRLRERGIALSLFLDPESVLAPVARDCGAAMVEIHTGANANATGEAALAAELDRIALAARAFHAVGLEVHAGHGITTANVAPLLRAFPFTELSIGHHIVSLAIEVGMRAAVEAMLAAMRA
ncbi:MAG TPA: pyridoxine 5'-phosphate synthase [Candidatus Omnitrophota bacterium]|nr:pyridoxine 5'-phosphate synthase [Candidatus Omnitrophota bacterium]